MQSKDSIRARMKAKRRALPPDLASELSTGVASNLESWVSYQEARSIMFYVSFAGEVSTGPLMERAIAAGKTVSVPKIHVIGRRMSAHIVKDPATHLERGAYGISVPVESAPEIDPGLLDMVIVPGLAFDPQGHRVGFGGGYYDRFLSRVREDCISVALAYGFQVVPSIPGEEYDLPVRYLITENGIMACRR